MQGMRFTISVHVGGTLAANQLGNHKLPCDCHLVAVSAGGSNANNGKLDVGTSADRDGILAAVDIGDSNTPTEWIPSDFAGALVTSGGSGYKFSKGDILAWDLDYDGATETATQNFDLLFTFTEG